MHAHTSIYTVQMRQSQRNKNKRENIHAAKLKQESFSDDTTTPHTYSIVVIVVVVRRTGTENYKHNKMLKLLGIKARRPTAVNTS